MTQTVTLDEGRRLARQLARELRGHRVTELLVASIADGVQITVVVPSAVQVAASTADIVDQFAVEHEDWEWGTLQVLWAEEQRQRIPERIRHPRWPREPRDPEDPELGAEALDGTTVEGARALAQGFLRSLVVGAPPGVASALQTGVARIGAAKAEAPVDIYRATFDLGIAIGLNPTTSQIVSWADDQVVKLPEAQKDPPSWPWSNDQVWAWSTTYSVLDKDTPRPMQWYARHLAFVMVLDGNGDVATCGAELLAGAQKVLAAPAFNDARPADTARIVNLYRWVLYDQAVLPANATWTRSYLVNAAKLAGMPRPPDGWDVLINVASETAEKVAEVVPELDPPGGFGVYLGGAILLFGGVAAWGLTTKTLPALTRR